MVLDNKQNSKKLAPEDFFNTSAVNITVAAGSAKRRVSFNAKIVSNPADINIFNPAKQWTVYRGKSFYEIPIPNEEFMGYGSSLVPSNSTLSPNIEYLSKVALDIPAFEGVSVMKADQGGEILLVSEGNYTALACVATASAPPKTLQASVKCTTLFSKDLREGQFIVVKASNSILVKNRIPQFNCCQKFGESLAS